MSLRLVVDDDHGYGGQVVVLDAELTLGRHPDCAVVLGDDPRVSRRHATIAPLDGLRAVVCDLDSRNGVFIDEVRINGVGVLEGGGLLRLGNTTLRLHGARSLTVR